MRSYTALQAMLHWTPSPRGAALWTDLGWNVGQHITALRFVAVLFPISQPHGLSHRSLLAPSGGQPWQKGQNSGSCSWQQLRRLLWVGLGSVIPVGPFELGVFCDSITSVSQLGKITCKYLREGRKKWLSCALYYFLFLLPSKDRDPSSSSPRQGEFIVLNCSWAGVIACNFLELQVRVFPLHIAPLQQCAVSKQQC